MPRTCWIAASALAVALTSTPAHAGKPQPPPTGPSIVAFGPSSRGYVAIDSRGYRYEFDVRGSSPSTLMLYPVTIVRNIFGGTLPSPIVNTTLLGPQVFLQLANGDLYIDNYDPLYPDQAFTNYLGNIISAAGARVNMPDLAPLEPAPPTGSEDDTTEPVQPGAVK